MKLWLYLALALLLSPLTSHSAEPYQDFGPYRVYYSVFDSTFVTPEVAKAYDLIRAKDKMLINVALVNTSATTDTYGLAATVTGTSRNLMQQQDTLAFQEIREQNAIYYLSPLKVSNEEMLHFTLKVTPAGKDTPFVVTFAKKMYVDK